jgi:hypothetical protein
LCNRLKAQDKRLKVQCARFPVPTLTGRWTPGVVFWLLASVLRLEVEKVEGEKERKLENQKLRRIKDRS